MYKKHIFLIESNYEVGDLIGFQQDLLKQLKLFNQKIQANNNLEFLFGRRRVVTVVCELKSTKPRL